MADLFSPTQGKRLFGFISAGGSLGAVVGPGLTALMAERVGVNVLLLYAAVGFGIAVVILRLLEREKAEVAVGQADGQTSRLDHALGGNLLDGFKLLARSPYLLLIAAFVVLTSWVSTILFFQQADLISQAFASREARAKTFATVDFIVNCCAILVQMFGTGRIAQRYGVTATLIINPFIMVLAFGAVLFSPGLMVMLAAQVLRRVSEYALAKPGREMLFTAVDQESKYKSKSVIDTAVTRLGDVSSAWITSGLIAVGLSVSGMFAIGIAVSLLWGGIGLTLGRQYERRRRHVTG
jgi:AAA family ATP:ADP antiporter